MIAQEDFLVIHKLHTLGYSVSKIARELGLDRKTVRAHLERPDPPTYRRDRRPSKLDPYRNWLRTRLQEAPLTATRLLRELRPLGYTGGYSILKRAVATLRPRPAPAVVVRFETPPRRAGPGRLRAVRAHVDGNEVVVGREELSRAGVTCETQGPLSKTLF